MILERTFSELHGNFWRRVMPRSEQMMRMLNASREQVMQPLKAAATPGRRGLINEVATRIVQHEIETARGIQNLSEEEILSAIAEAQRFIQRFRAGSGVEIPPLRKRDVAESVRIAKRLLKQLAPYLDGLRLYVPIRGAGIIDSCEVDGLAGVTLLEFKAGNRLCRSRDLRQVLTYVALMHLARTPQTNNTICILNPRVGWRLVASVDTVLEMSGGKTFDAFLAEFEYYVTDVTNISNG